MFRIVVARICSSTIDVYSDSLALLSVFQRSALLGQGMGSLLLRKLRIDMDLVLSMCCNCLII